MFKLLFHPKLWNLVAALQCAIHTIFEGYSDIVKREFARQPIMARLYSFKKLKITYVICCFFTIAQISYIPVILKNFFEAKEQSS